jgi:hypothetical protein
MRKLPGKIDGRLITREFFPEMVGMESEINRGNCYRWAYIAYILYKDVSLYSNDAHAFAYQYGKFFDSESPSGVTRMESLKCNKYNCKKSCHSWLHPSVDDFVEFWDENGRYEFRDKPDLDRKINNFWRRYLRKNKSTDSSFCHP